MAEIILGGRRPARGRKLVRALLFGAPVVVIAAIVAAVSFQRATTYPVPKGSGAGGPLVAEGARLVVDGSSLERVGRVWVLRTQGAPWAMGVARGRLLGERAASAGLALDATIIGEREPEGWFARQRARAGWRWDLRLLADGLPRERLTELAGLAAGLRRAGFSHPSYQTLVRRQVALDLGAAPGAGLPLGGVAAGFAFATAGVDDDNGRVLLGRAFALPGAPGAGEPVVTIARPEGAIAYASVGWADQVGVVTGVNAEGVAVALQPAVTDDVEVSRARPPLAAVARDVLERARDLDEAIAIVKAAEPLGSGSFLLVDGEARRFAVVERSPRRTSVRRGKADDKLPPPLAIGEWLVGGEFARDAENERARRRLGREARQARLAALLARKGPATLANVLAVLRDRGDRVLPLGHPDAIDDAAAQHVVVIDPAGLWLWVGESAAAAGPLRAFDLRAELRAEPARALDPLEAVVPAEPAADPETLERLALARDAGARAGRLMRAGRAREAAEQAARALALAPELPEAWRLAAHLARAAGDEARARELYRGYLAREPVDPAGLEEARGFVGGP